VPDAPLPATGCPALSAGGGERGSDDVIECRHWPHVGTRLVERCSRVPLLESEVAERAEGVGERLGCLRTCRSAVGRSVGMPEGEAAGHRALDNEEPAMHGAVVRAAQDAQALGVVFATSVATVKMVDIAKDAGPAAGHDATAT